MTKYSDGYRFECSVRDDLKSAGYEVMRAAGSKGKIDLMAFKTGEILFVQCKLNGKCSLGERREILRLSEMVEAVPLVAYKHKEGSRAAEVKYRMLLDVGPYDFKEWGIG